MKKEIIKKGTDILDVGDSSGEYHFLIKTKSKDGKAIIAALEKIVGSPVLEDYADDYGESQEITIRRYRPKEDLELAEE